MARQSGMAKLAGGRFARIDRIGRGQDSQWQGERFRQTRHHGHKHALAGPAMIDMNQMRQGMAALACPLCSAQGQKG